MLVLYVHIQHQLLSNNLNDPVTVLIILFFGINTTDISSNKVVLYGEHSVIDLVVEYIAQNAGFAGWLLYQCCGIQVVVYKLHKHPMPHPHCVQCIPRSNCN